MRLLLLLILLLQTHNTFANMDFYFSGASKTKKVELSNLKNYCPYRTNYEELNIIIGDLILNYFPNLLDDYKNNRIHIREMTSNSHLIKTFIQLGSILDDSRHYRIDIHKSFYNCAPPKDALFAILAHELKHIDDYKDTNSLSLLKVSLEMFSRKNRSIYERETDFFIMQLGFAQALRDYRNWNYKNISKKSRQKNQCYYFTPEEINRYLQGEVDFSDYYNKYCKNLSSINI